MKLTERLLWSSLCLILGLALLIRVRDEPQKIAEHIRMAEKSGYALGWQTNEERWAKLRTDYIIDREHAWLTRLDRRFESFQAYVLEQQSYAKEGIGWHARSTE